MKDSYQNCENEIFDLYLNRELFNERNSIDFMVGSAFDGNDFNDRAPVHTSGLEIIVRPECNQKCEYCYVARYGHELYPLSERVSNEVLLKNLDMLLTYIFTTRHTYINHFELFAGDLFYDDFYFDILDVFWNHLSSLYHEYPSIFKAFSGLILTPCNFSFIDDDEKVAKVERYMEQFKTINWDIGFSISTDGKEMVEGREQRELPEDHFDKLFKWTERHHKSGFHAIISAANVKNMIKSYDWWKEQYDKYYVQQKEIHPFTRDFLPYWLEARNDEWTDEAIEDYLKFIDYAYADRFAMHDNDPEKMAYHIFVGDEKMEGTLPKLAQNDPIRLSVNVQAQHIHEIGCSMTHLVCVTLNNFAFIPCHRLNYPQFRGGYLTLNDDKTAIEGCEAFNAAGLLAAKFCHSDSRPKCATCIYAKVCDKGCLGAQFESTGELFQPALTVCRLFKAWYNHLVLLYKDTGVYDAAYSMRLIKPEQASYLDAILDAAIKDRETKRHFEISGGVTHGICP